MPELQSDGMERLRCLSNLMPSLGINQPLSEVEALRARLKKAMDGSGKTRQDLEIFQGGEEFPQE